MFLYIKYVYASVNYLLLSDRVLVDILLLLLSIFRWWCVNSFQEIKISGNIFIYIACYNQGNE